MDVVISDVVVDLAEGGSVAVSDSKTCRTPNWSPGPSGRAIFGSVKHYELSQAQWERIAPLQPGEAGDSGRTAARTLLSICSEFLGADLLANKRDEGLHPRRGTVLPQQVHAACAGVLVFTEQPL